jgi:hypothetical protein
MPPVPIYLGGKLIATSENGTLRYVHQACPRAKRRNSLSSTSLMTDSVGAQVGTTIKYLPFGICLQSPDIPTDKLFTRGLMLPAFTTDTIIHGFALFNFFAFSLLQYS